MELRNKHNYTRVPRWIMKMLGSTSTKKSRKTNKIERQRKRLGRLHNGRK